jgi:N-ethylmaleimide reductase
MSKLEHLLSPATVSGHALKNRVVMAPMTRSRAIHNVPNGLMATYYQQRAGAGLIVTEGTAPSPNGLGYPRIPGIYSEEQVDGWRDVTEGVHQQDGKIFLQIMHVGRIAHPLNLPEGGEIVAPSAIQAAGKMYTDEEGLQPHPTPRKMELADIETALEEFEIAARNAAEAGFDGIELHGANGYLIDQFINPQSNQRNDDWGGSIENRNQFAIEVARRTANAIGEERVGIRLSPFGAFNDLGPFEEAHEQFTELAARLGELNLAYIHLVDHSSMGSPDVPDSIKRSIREAFGGPIILSGGYDANRAEQDLAEQRAELIAFGRPFISNPDLVERFRKGAELAEPQQDRFYSAGEEGYTDYPPMD